MLDFTEPRIRAGHDSDAEGFIALIGACWAEYPGCVLDVDAEVPELRALGAYFAGQGGMLWVAEQAGAVVGMVGTRPSAGTLWELCKVYVGAVVRGTGLAHRLADQAERFARMRGAAAMELWSDTRFTRAHAFYIKRGYALTGETRDLHDLSATVEYRFSRTLNEDIWEHS